MTELNKITEKIICSAIEVHKELGPGLLESAYETCLFSEMTEAGLIVINQVKLPLLYKGKEMPHSYRLDFLVEDKIIIELKAVEKFLPIHQAQLLSYLKLSDLRLGLLINFNEVVLKNGIKRIANGKL